MKRALISMALVVNASLFACELPELKAIALTAAKHFTLQQFRDGYLIEVLSPWEQGTKKKRYVLYRKGIAPTCADTLAIQIPVKRLVAFSTSYLPALKELQQLDSLVATVDARYISDPIVRSMVQDGKVSSLGYPPAPEKILSLSPGLIMVFVSESPEMEGVARLEQLKLPVVYNADFREEHPLGRAEWIRFIGAFYDQENLASTIYAKVEKNYQMVRSKISHLKKRPRVLLGEKKGNVWQAPGGASYLRRFVEEAGGEYLYQENRSKSPQNIPFEEVYRKLKGIDVWISFLPWKNYRQVIAEDRRNEYFFNNRIKVFFGNKLQSENGGNDYFETGALRPDLVLSDFISMLHPELVPAHQLKWFIELVKERRGVK